MITRYLSMKISLMMYTWILAYTKIIFLQDANVMFLVSSSRFSMSISSCMFHVDPKEHLKLSQFNPAVQRGTTEKNIQSLITVNTMVFKQNYNDDKIFRCLTWYHVKIPAFDMQCTWIFSFTFPHFCHLWNGCHYEELRETANREVCMVKVLSNDEFH